MTQGRVVRVLGGEGEWRSGYIMQSGSVAPYRITYQIDNQLIRLALHLGHQHQKREGSCSCSSTRAPARRGQWQLAAGSPPTQFYASESFVQIVYSNFFKYCVV